MSVGEGKRRLRNHLRNQFVYLYDLGIRGNRRQYSIPPKLKDSGEETRRRRSSNRTDSGRNSSNKMPPHFRALDFPHLKATDSRSETIWQLEFAHASRPSYSVLPTHHPSRVPAGFRSAVLPTTCLLARVESPI